MSNYVFVPASTRADAISIKGRDWAKIVKTTGGYMFFETIAAWREWCAQR